MLDVEAGYVQKEMEDYLLLSTNDLKAKVEERKNAWRQANASVEGALAQLPECDALALRCIIVRDFYHLLELYFTYLGSRGQEAGPSAPARAKGKPEPLPYSDSLFG